MVFEIQDGIKKYYFSGTPRISIIFELIEEVEACFDKKFGVESSGAF